MNILGYVLPAASIGLGSLLLKPQRGFYPSQELGPVLPITADVTIEEMHQDTLEITEHPVEQGASITDHSYVRPKEVTIHCAWSNSPSTPGGLPSQAAGAAAAIGGTVVGIAASANQTIGAIGNIQSNLSGNAVGQCNQIYQTLLALQTSRIPFTIYTGKRTYQNMLFRSLSVTTDVKTENTLVLTATCRQVILVSTQVVSVPINKSALANPEANTPTINQGTQSLATPANTGTTSL